MPGSISILDRARDYVSNLPSGSEIRASDVSKKFNFSNPSAASKHIALMDGTQRIGKGIFVKL